jgi:hypothetical protein
VPSGAFLPDHGAAIVVAAGRMRPMSPALLVCERTGVGITRRSLAPSRAMLAFQQCLMQAHQKSAF